MSQTLKKVGIPLAIIIGAVVVTAVMISSKKPPEKEEVEQKAFLVDAISVETRDLNFIVKSQGTVVPKVQTVLSAQVSGQVVDVSDAFIEGGMFRKGDVLVQLEQADYITDLKAAEAELSRNQAALEEERARGKVAEEEWRTVKGSVAPELGLRKPQLAREIANVRAAEAQVERAQRNLERTTIRAPYDGLVRATSVDLGQFVVVGNQLGTIFGTDVAEVRLPLSDNDLAYLELPEVTTEGLHPQVTLHTSVAGKQASWQGILARSEGVVDDSSRVIFAVVQIQDPYHRDTVTADMPLKYGRFVQAEVTGNRGEGLVVLPRNYLRLDGTVMVVDKERKLRIREVTVQRADEESVYISGGLASGELVTSTAIPNAVDGMAVRLPQDDDQASASPALAATGG